MKELNWIEDLVNAEQQMEESGIVDFSAGFDPHGSLKTDTLDFLTDLKQRFIQSATEFNQLKGTALGRLKIYGISKTEADFMIFRNGFKLIFSIKEPGKILISFNHLGSTYVPGQEASSNPTKMMEENMLVSKWGAFGDLTWTFQDQTIKPDYLVRHHLSRFIKESVK